MSTWLRLMGRVLKVLWRGLILALYIALQNKKKDPV